MHTTLLIAITSGLCGMIGWGLADFFAKKTIDTIGDIPSLAWAHIFGTAAMAVCVIFAAVSGWTKISIPADTSTWGGLLFFGVLQAVIYLLVYNGFAKGQVAVLNPVFSSFSGLVALVSILFLGEHAGHFQLSALGVLFLGVLLLNLDPAAFGRGTVAFIRVPGFKEVGVATVLATVWTLGWDRFIHGNDWLGYSFLMYLFMTIAILAYARTKGISLRFNNTGVWKFLILIGLCETLAYVGVSYGYSSTPSTSIVAVLSGAFSLPTVICARLFLREKTNAMQAIGSILIILGIIILSLL